MKKFLKTTGLVITAFTVGEFVTMWRLQTTPQTLREFTKSYLGSQPAGLKASREAGRNLNLNPPVGKAQVKKIIFPNQ